MRAQSTHLRRRIPIDDTSDAPLFAFFSKAHREQARLDDGNDQGYGGAEEGEEVKEVERRVTQVYQPSLVHQHALALSSQGSPFSAKAEMA